MLVWSWFRTMAIATTLRRFLTANGVGFQEHIHPRTDTLEEAAASCQAPPAQFARAVLLSDGVQMLMAIIPLNSVLDLEKAGKALGRAVQPVTAAEADRRFSDCEPGSHPPVPEPYGLKAVIEEALLRHDRLWFEAGAHTALLSVSGQSYGFLCSRAVKTSISAVVPVAPPPCGLEGAEFGAQIARLNLPSDAEVQKKLEQVYRLPAIPAVATQILQLVSDPDSTAKDLSELVEMDPSIAAQVIRYARSSFFGYRGNVDSIQTAITRVLGFDIVSNLALGIAAGKVFKLAADGPLGLDQFWRHAVYNAAVVQGLTRVLPRSLGVKPGTAYLCGLLHNFGVLLLGHLFQPEYFLLNKMCLANPGCGLPAIERRILCVGSSQKLVSLGHANLGSWLMQHWKMPDEVIEVTAHHHDDDYKGSAPVYVQLVRLANALLARDGIGDTTDTTLPADALATLGISEEAALQLYADVGQHSEELDRMARLMSGASDDGRK